MAKLAAKPDSLFGGVQVGANVPYSFHNMSGTADKILEYMNQLDLSAAELRLQPVEAYLGAPGVYASSFDAPGRGRRGAGAPAGGRGPGGGDAARGTRGPGGARGGRAPLTPEQQAARAEEAKKLSDWRLSLSMDKIKNFRKKYETAGVLIQILKVDNFNSFSDGVTDYFFEVAKNLGAHAISTEGRLSDIERLGKFADKHKMMVGYHGHTAGPGGEAFGAPENWEKAMAVAKYNGINLDLGHFVVGNHTSPIPFMTKYHDRVTHIHVKDRKYDGATVPFGQGDVPIVEALQLMKKNQWKFQATIEFEYPVPEGSDLLTEMGKCVEYCKKALA
ncbi:MAG TPA: TIM barrel protein [Bryobacteraceae bacterium]|nr:TIM barrel protein [Bryobacteraceae bacterium]